VVRSVIVEEAWRDCGGCAGRRGARGAGGCGGSDDLGSLFSRTVVAEMRTTAALGEGLAWSQARGSYWGWNRVLQVRRRSGRSVGS
jgi:hypothetical protein